MREHIEVWKPLNFHKYYVIFFIHFIVQNRVSTCLLFETYYLCIINLRAAATVGEIYKIRLIYNHTVVPRRAIELLNYRRNRNIHREWEWVNSKFVVIIPEHAVKIYMEGVLNHSNICRFHSNLTIFIRVTASTDY